MGKPATQAKTDKRLGRSAIGGHPMTPYGALLTPFDGLGRNGGGRARPWPLVRRTTPDSATAPRRPASCVGAPYELHYVSCQDRRHSKALPHPKKAIKPVKAPDDVKAQGAAAPAPECGRPELPTKSTPRRHTCPAPSWPASA